MTGTSDYCREIETYLCRKNDGHLIRVVGPSFDLVSSWADRGVPLNIAFSGIDRYFERYYRKGPRRRPVRIDFCEADVLDVFDEWRRAIGLPTSPLSSLDPPASDVEPSATSKRQSLSAHLNRVVLRLTSARATGRIDGQFDELIDRVSRELDAAAAASRGLRGEARQTLLARLRGLDAELLRSGRAALDEPARTELARAADDELAPFRASMSAEVLARTREAALDQKVREHFGLPNIAFD